MFILYHKCAYISEVYLKLTILITNIRYSILYSGLVCPVDQWYLVTFAHKCMWLWALMWTPITFFLVFSTHHTLYAYLNYICIHAMQNLLFNVLYYIFVIVCIQGNDRRMRREALAAGHRQSITEHPNVGWGFRQLQLSMREGDRANVTWTEYINLKRNKSILCYNTNHLTQ